MESQKGLKNHRSFISNLKQLLNCDQYDGIIVISQDYNGFTILDESKFKNQVLKNHFRNSNWASFRRQLNQYGFVYQKTDQGHLKYTNQQFDIRNQDGLKISKKVQEKEMSYDQEMFLLQLQLSEIKSNQIKMVESFQNLLKQHKQIEINLKQSMIEYITHIVDGQKRGTKLGKFVWKFHLNIKDKKYKQFLYKIWLKANQQGELLFSDQQQQSKFLQSLYSYESFNDEIQGLMFPKVNAINEEVLSLCSFAQNSQDENHFEERQSNISNYFNI
ncbi:unnamed protein product [Paramecium sonneborni]|uniref:HSF-type DNA-binding domain-containing protein n=1 Tax=Paramecium sonneborni TaxID=65129 RepID=A0A8S1RII4_9CILI|nr:unnamed protein product [Paramecium sonneborni]